jgi:hypothetical protein
VNWRDPDGMGRDRGTAARPDGTENPFKKLTPDPDDPTKVIYKDPNTGKKTKKAKPPGFDEYWKKKHPQQQPKPNACPAPEPKPKPAPNTSNVEDYYCSPGQTSDCEPRMTPGIFGMPVNPNMPRIPLRIPLRIPFPAFEFPVFAW